MAEASGAQLGAYRIVGPIGTGAFATVYRATDERFGTDVAVKILAENHSLDPEIRERFLAEARLLRRLSHPNVITVYDIGETARRQPFLVMELATCSLRDRRDEIEAVTTADMRAVASSLGAGLAALHRGRVVHRDVSPQNLLVLGPTEPDSGGGLLAKTERLALADLGFAKDLTAHSGLTAGGGTAGFSPPDQRRGTTTADPADDVYSASAVLAWLATGRSPTGASPTASDYVLETDAGRLAIEIDRGLSRNRSRRHPDIDHWTASITDALTSTAPTVLASRSTARRRSWLAAVAVAAALIIGAIVGWVAHPHSGSTSSTQQIIDGRRRVQVVDDGTVAAIFGPERITAGAEARFDAGVTGGVSYFWIDHEGQVIADEPSLTVPEVTEDTDAVTLVVVRADGRPVTVTYDFSPDDR